VVDDNIKINLRTTGCKDIKWFIMSEEYTPKGGGAVLTAMDIRALVTA
jgi:hypothetical protein